MNHNGREVALRAHIREQLLVYALTHLTFDYVQHTEDVVSGVSYMRYDLLLANQRPY
jgi:hypothetical protein